MALCWVLLACCWLGSAGSASAASPAPLGKGVFLVASPALQDPNFLQSVILICEHGPEGTLGVVLNRPTGLLLSEALPQISVLKGTSYVLFAGGPVQPGGILMLFRVTKAPQDSRSVMEGIYLGGDLETLTQVITKPEPTETFRAFAGYAGWAPGQLEAELTGGSWAVVPADSFSIFDKDPANLWADLVEALKTPGPVRAPVIPAPSRAQGITGPHHSRLRPAGEFVVIRN
ncbi:MAG: YqgE/AlgH family protein [Nitrospirota bacterium]